MMEETSNVTIRDLLFTKPSGVGANCEAFNHEGHGEMVLVYARRSKVGQTT